MCKITNEQVKELLKNFRTIDSITIEKTESETLAEVLDNIKIWTDEIDLYEKKIKKELVERKEGEVFYFPNLEKKVYLSEGKNSTTFDSKEVYNSFVLRDKVDLFLDVISIKVTAIKDLAKKDDDVKDIVEFNEKTDKGNPYFTVVKMNKKELVEHSK